MSDQPITDEQLDKYAELAITADHDGVKVDPAVVTALVDEVHRRQLQVRYLLSQIAKKDAQSGEADKRLREFLAPDEDETPDESETTMPVTGAGQHTSTLAITITAPTAENANAWADTLADLVTAEHGDQMRLDIRINPLTLPRHGDWKVTRSGVTLHTAATRAEAQAVGTFAIRQENNNPTAPVQWACPVCYGDDQECQDCSDDTVWYLAPMGVWTDASYAVERVPAAPRP